MTWYKSGTVSVTQNSSAVIGAGTAFIANSRVGDAFRGPDGNWYEVINIASDTALAIAPNYQGATVTAGTYALAPMQGYVKDTADALRQASLEVGDALDGLEESVQQAADSAAAALGSKNAAATSEANASASAGAALSSKNAAATSETNAGASATAAMASKNAAAVSETNAAASAATAATLGVGRDYVDGFRMTYVSANSISFSSGSVYIPSTAKNLLSPSTITLSGLVLTASTMYHAYFYDNAGTPAIELVTTAPVIYSGKARHKTGDTSRRYIGSALSKTTNTLMKFTHVDGRVSYGETLFSAPFLLVSGAVNAPQTVSCLPILPITATHLSCMLQNAATDTYARLGNPDQQAPVSSASHSYFVLAGSASSCDLPLSNTQSFQWRHDGAANALFYVYANGYLFERWYMPYAIKADGQLRSVSATMVLEDDETLVEELPNWLLTKLEEIGILAGKAASEGAWRSEELSATARQLEALEEAEADVPPADLLGGTRKAWLRYRGQLSSWKEGSLNFPDRSFRPTRPDPDLIKHV